MVTVIPMLPEEEGFESDQLYKYPTACIVYDFVTVFSIFSRDSLRIYLRAFKTDKKVNHERMD